MQFSERWVLALLLPLALLPAACDGPGRYAALAATLAGPAASFEPSGAATEPDGVRLTGTATGDSIELEVVIGGSTSSSDLYGFAFHLVLGDGAVVELVEGSATFGDALTLDGTQEGIVLAAQRGNRIVVGVTKWGGGSGNAVVGDEACIVRMVLRVVERGASSVALAGSAVSGPAAYDSGGAPVQSVRFDPMPALISRL